MKKSVRKALRKATVKRIRKNKPAVRIAKPTIKTYQPKKKAYEKPALGSMPKPDFHVYGLFDGYVNKGTAGALNRIERDRPGTFEWLVGLVNQDLITWDRIEKLFAAYYFEDREKENRNFDYFTNPFEVYDSGFENFVMSVKLATKTMPGVIY